jgi:hypothetical protein
MTMMMGDDLVMRTQNFAPFCQKLKRGKIFLDYTYAGLTVPPFRD